MIKAVIFDLDDTLYEERQFVQGGFRAVAHYMFERYKVNEDLFFESLLRIYESNGRGHVFDIAISEVNLFQKSLVNTLVQKYRYHQPHLCLFPDAQYVLLQLKKSYKLGLITDGNQRVQRSKIDALRLRSFFDVIITTTSFGLKNQKPACLPYQKAINILNIQPAEAIFVGDNPHKDFAGARKLGISTIRVLRGPYKTLTLAPPFEADYNVNDLKCLPEFLLRFPVK